jgi:hypothetical protein
MILTASSVHFLVKHIFSIFTKQSDKPFSAYADRCAASFHACKADEKSFRIPGFFSIFKNGLTR